MILEVPSEPGGDAMNDSGVERLKQIYTLNIITQRNDGTKRMCQLQFPGTQTILEIKTNVSSLTNIAVEQQVWTGWPPNVTDDKMLGVSDIPLESNLSLQAASASAETADAGKPLEPVDKFYDATDSGNWKQDAHSFYAHWSYATHAKPILNGLIELEKRI